MWALVAATRTLIMGPGFTVMHEEATFETFHLAEALRENETKNMF